jgi:hypothetical protein
MTFGTTDIALIAIAIALWCMVIWGIDVTA